MKRPESYHEGANDERDAWMARLERDSKGFYARKTKFPVIAYIKRLQTFGASRVRRNRARKGGL